MNRKQRRAMQGQGPRSQGFGGQIAQGVGNPAGQAAPASAAESVRRLFGEAVRHQHLGKLNEAARLYRQVLSLEPDHAEASNNLGCVFLAQGKLREARARFERALVLVPQLLDDFASIRALLLAANPAIGEGMKHAAAAWPQRLPATELLGPAGIAAAFSDALLVHVLESTSVRDIDLERLLTSIRLELLRAVAAPAGDRVDEAVLGACCVLARQCFINEYVFAVTPEEAEQAQRLRDRLVDTLRQGARLPSPWPAAVAMYWPLHSLPGAQALLDRAWPAPLAEVVEQQVREPSEELQFRDSIAALTAIEDDVSVLVRRQYEEHPYPRWVRAASVPAPVTLDEHLRNTFPSTPFRPLGNTDGIDVLVAGCGTGRHPIEVAQKYLGARVLAIDLSLASLCYAKRKTPASLASRIEYAQADILKLGAIDRTFDLIDASGVLHHLADPLAGWRALLSRLRPDGFMRVGLYSELARRDIVAARAFIAERGYQPTDDDIRRCRQELLSTPLTGATKAGDFFSTSECRDLLFHFQESRMTIPQIKTFLAEHGLRFIGFEFAPQVLQHYRGLLGGDNAMRDLDRWHAFETARPDTFAGMYQFWIQKD